MVIMTSLSKILPVKVERLYDGGLPLAGGGWMSIDNSITATRVIVGIKNGLLSLSDVCSNPPKISKCSFCRTTTWPAKASETCLTTFQIIDRKLPTLWKRPCQHVDWVTSILAVMPESLFKASLDTSAQRRLSIKLSFRSRWFLKAIKTVSTFPARLTESLSWRPGQVNLYNILYPKISRNLFKPLFILQYTYRVRVI